jgi:DNA-binding MarR family transcriptional regulator
MSPRAHRAPVRVAAPRPAGAWPEADGGPGADDGVDELVRLLGVYARFARSPAALEWIDRRAGLELPRHLHTVSMRIAASEPIALVDLAPTIDLDRSAVSRQAAELERRGLVKRSVSPWDARATLLTLTRRGRTTADTFHRLWLALLDEAVKTWTPEVRHDFAGRLAELLHNVGTAIGAADDASDPPSVLSLAELTNAIQR